MLLPFIATLQVMLPIVATAAGTIRSKLRPREKWGSCLMAAHQIVDQIYKYRLRTAQYVAMPDRGGAGTISSSSP